MKIIDSGNVLSGEKFLRYSLGRWFLLQTFDNDVECDVAEIRQILDEDDDCGNQDICR